MKKISVQDFRPAQLRLSFTPPLKQIKLSTPKDLYKAFRAIWDESLLPIQEQFYILYLNNANELLTWSCLHTGTSCNAQIDMKLLLGTAVGCVAQKIAIAHNHPSGKIHPSELDTRLTHRIADACYLHDIELMDHLVLSKSEYFSYAAVGLI